MVALSFVQKAGDVQELKNVVQGRCRVRGKGAKKNAENTHTFYTVVTVL